MFNFWKLAIKPLNEFHRRIQHPPRKLACFQRVDDFKNPRLAQLYQCCHIYQQSLNARLLFATLRCHIPLRNPPNRLSLCQILRISADCADCSESPLPAPSDGCIRCRYRTNTPPGLTPAIPYLPLNSQSEPPCLPFPNHASIHLAPVPRHQPSRKTVNIVLPHRAGRSVAGPSVQSVHPRLGPPPISVQNPRTVRTKRTVSYDSYGGAAGPAEFRTKPGGASYDSYEMPWVQTGPLVQLAAGASLRFPPALAFAIRCRVLTRSFMQEDHHGKRRRRGRPMG